jgi:hypothetical protein
LPVAEAENAAGDLLADGGRDLDELSGGWREMIGARKEVSEDGLQMAVAEEAAGYKRRGDERLRFEGG